MREIIERLEAEWELTRDGRLEADGKVWHRYWPEWTRMVGDNFDAILTALRAGQALADAKRAYLEGRVTMRDVDKKALEFLAAFPGEETTG